MPKRRLFELSLGLVGLLFIVNGLAGLLTDPLPDERLRAVAAEQSEIPPEQWTTIESGFERGLLGSTAYAVYSAERHGQPIQIAVRLARPLYVAGWSIHDAGVREAITD
jgi:hypothetical protein